MKHYGILFFLLSILPTINATQQQTVPDIQTITIPLNQVLPNQQIQEQLHRSVAQLAQPPALRTPSILVATNSNYPVDISFCIADIKYRNNALKILEMGEGSRSKFEGFDQLYGRGKIWSRFWYYLAQFNVPMFYVGPRLRRSTARDQIAFRDFRDLGGTYMPSKQTCSKFIQATHTYSFPLSAPKTIENYHAITVLRHQNASSAATLDFKKQNPLTLVLNYAAAPYVNNKFLTNTLFDEPGLERYKPTWKVYQKHYTKDLAQKIIDEINAKIFVIKPINAFKGNGVIMVRRNKLDYILKNILQKRAIIRNSTDPTYNYWIRDHNDSFIVEKFENSKTVRAAGKPYEPTLRVVFALHYSKQVISLTFFGSYWKLPKRSTNEKGTLAERTKSSIDKTGQRPSSMIVDADDMARVKKVLIKILPKLYVKMLQTRHLIP